MLRLIRTGHGRISVVTMDGLAESAAQYLSAGKNFQTTSVTTAARWFGMNNCEIASVAMQVIRAPQERPLVVGEIPRFRS